MFRLGNFIPPTTPLTTEGDLTWRQQPYGNSQWSSEKTILDSSNYRNYIDWIVDKVVMNDYEMTDNYGIPQWGTAHDGNFDGGSIQRVTAYNYIIFKNSTGKNNLMIQWGTLTMGNTHVDTATASFITSFASTPTVFCQNMSTGCGGVVLSITQVSSSSFSVKDDKFSPYGNDSATENASIIFWLAIGKC